MWPFWTPVCSTPVDQYKPGVPKRVSAASNFNIRPSNGPGGVGLLSSATSEMVYNDLVGSNFTISNI